MRNAIRQARINAQNSSNMTAGEKQTLLCLLELQYECIKPGVKTFEKDVRIFQNFLMPDSTHAPDMDLYDEEEATDTEDDAAGDSETETEDAIEDDATVTTQMEPDADDKRKYPALVGVYRLLKTPGLLASCRFEVVRFMRRLYIPW